MNQNWFRSIAAMPLGIWLLAVAVPQAHADPTGLVSWWKAEGNVTDTQGNNPGVDVNGVQYVTGLVGQAFSLTANQHIDVASPTFNSYASGFTIAGWINLSSYNQTADIINFRSPSNVGGFLLEEDFNNNGGISFAVNQSGVANQYVGVDSATGWNLNTWYHIAATFDSSTGVMDIYRDGSLAATNTVAALPFASVSSSSYNINDPSTDRFEIGRDITNGANYTGLIDELQFYDHALTASEVAGLTGVVPEPGRISLLTLGMAGLLLRCTRRRRAPLV